MSGVPTPLPECQLLTILDYQTCYQITVETNYFITLYTMIGDTNHFNIILLNINLNVRNMRTMEI